MRLRLQLQSRYPGTDVSVDPATFSLRVSGAGIDTTLPLAPLHHACLREPGRVATLIAEYVRGVERQLTPATGLDVRADRLLWCVRSHRYLEHLNRAAELIDRPIGAGMVAFIAESLPGALMRGVPRVDLEAVGLDVAAARAAAEANTVARFSKLVDRIRGADRVPADGWRLSGDPLYQGSALLVPEVLAAFAERAGGEVLLAVPDRGLVLAMPAALPSAPQFQMRVLRAWREAMNPCSRDVLVTDGATLGEVPRGRRARRGPELMAWLWQWPT